MLKKFVPLFLIALVSVSSTIMMSSYGLRQLKPSRASISSAEVGPHVPDG